MLEDAPSEVEAFAQIAELRRLNADLERRLKRAKMKAEDLVHATYEGVRAAAIQSGPAKIIDAPKRDARKRRPEVALLQLSDLHFGKETTGFNCEVAAERVAEVARRTLAIADIERADHPIREIVVLLSGDLVENLGIFPGQGFEVDASLFDQMMAARKAVCSLLLTLLANFDHVHVHEAWGNHGRFGRKGDFPSGDNADRIVGEFVHADLVGYESAGRLTWSHPKGHWFGIVEIGNYRALHVHGHQIKSFGGNVPAFGIARKCNAWLAGAIREPFLHVHMGHFHQPLVVPLANGGQCFVSPSLESESDYATEFVGSHGEPGQRLFFVDPEKGRLTSERLLWLAH